MPLQFDAFAALRALRERYPAFLQDTYRLRPGPMREELERALTARGDDGQSLFSPLLVETPFPFAPGQRIRELESPDLTARDPQRPLHPRTVALLEAAGVRWPLYRHQVQVIRDAAAGKTAVLSAGTGSGKTEAFLIPLIDDLHWNHERGLDPLDQPGVRALVVYPLNALVNNQIQRMLDLLRHQSGITFAFYTSRLPETRGRAGGIYGEQLPPDCQIVDRRSLRGIRMERGAQAPKLGPPHILITNFSMLQYMLIRPIDRSIFLPDRLRRPDGQPRLRQIVLDEAHVYAGAQAAEIHMLLRRACMRFGTRLEAVQGLATSATLSAGAGGDAERILQEFAGRMFAKPPSKVAARLGRRYLPLLVEESRVDRPLRCADAPVPDDLQTLDIDDEGRALGLTRDPDGAAAVLACCQELGLAEPGAEAELSDEDRTRPARLLYWVMARNRVTRELRDWLGDRRRVRLEEVAARLFPGQAMDEDRMGAAARLLRLCAMARLSHTEAPFIPVRNHLFVRAPIGAWVRPAAGQPGADWPWGPITLHPPALVEREAGEPDELASSGDRLELLLCSTCSAPYLNAWWEPGDADFGEPPSWSATERFSLRPVAITAAASSEGLESFELPEAWGGHAVHVLDFKAGARFPRVESCCLRCGAEGAQLIPMRQTAPLALGAVLDTLYPHLNEKPGGAVLPAGGRRILTFTDSRQGAAQVASNVESTHDLGLTRWLVWHALPESGQDVPLQPSMLSPHSLLAGLVQLPQLRYRPLAAERDLDEEDLAGLAMLCVYQTLARAPSRAQTLESLGLVEVIYPSLPPRPPHVAAAGMSEEEWRCFLAELLDDVRRRGGVLRPAFPRTEWGGLLAESLPKGLGLPVTLAPPPGEEDEPAEDDEAAEEQSTYRVIPIRWLVAEQHRARSRRYRYAGRVAEALGGGLTTTELLSAAWDALAADGKHRKWWRDSERGFRIDLLHLRFARRDGPPWIDPATSRASFRSLRGVSPRLEEGAKLRPPTEVERRWWRRRHGLRRVVDDTPLPLWTEEHTASIGVEQLERTEGAFKRGERNLLASSTTMEMGIDLGGLTLVVLTNVPPTRANYDQRGGRAGRRSDGSSLVLTLVQGRPHDQKVFADPLAFLDAAIDPPLVRLDTLPLLQRHANAWLLARFFERVVKPTDAGNPTRAFGSVHSFFLETDLALLAEGLRQDVAAGAWHRDGLWRLFLRWLEELPAGVLDGLRRFCGGTALSTLSPVDVARRCGLRMERVAVQVRAAAAMLDRQEAEALEAGAGAADESLVKALRHQRRKLQLEFLISRLVQGGFLPRFGFPIDVVKLDADWEFPRKDSTSREDLDKGRGVEGADLRLERGLDQALGSYSPGNEVVAAKRVHRVRGLTFNRYQSEQGMVRRKIYIECNRCGHIDSSDAAIERCSRCGHPVRVSATQTAEEAEQEFIEIMYASRRKGAALNEGVIPPTPLRHFLRPQGFSVKVGDAPTAAGSRSSFSRMPPARVRIGGTSEQTPSDQPVSALFTPETRLLVRSEGFRDYHSQRYGYGYAICQVCGAAEPERRWAGPRVGPPPLLKDHRKLRGGKVCDNQGDRYWRNAVLGAESVVDVFRLRLAGALAPNLSSQDDRRDFAMSLAAAMIQHAARRLRVDPRGLHPGVCAWRDGAEVRQEAVIYEDHGSGLLSRLVDEAEALVLEVSDDILSGRSAADYVRFDNQFSAFSGQLRVGLLRAHFQDPAVQQALADLRDPARVLPEGGALRSGRDLRHEVVELLQGEVTTLLGRRVHPAALKPGGVLNALRGAALTHGAGSARLLLARRPDRGASDSDELTRLRVLRALLESQVECRVLAHEDQSLLDRPWRVTGWQAGLRAALGPLADISNEAGDFDPGWLRGQPVLAAPAELTEALHAAVEEAWSRAEVLRPESLIPDQDPSALRNIVDVPQGETGQAGDLLRAVLTRALEVPPEAWGQVRSLTYSDIYVGRSPIGMWTLEQLLSILRFAEGSKVAIHTSDRNLPEPELAVEDVRARYFSGWPMKNLPEGHAQRLMATVGQSFRQRWPGRAWRVDWKRWLPHARRLTLELEGGVYARVDIRFDHGLQFFQTPDQGCSWSEQPFHTLESYLAAIGHRD